MRIKQITTTDGHRLTYYVAGQGSNHLLIVNAPGMSIKFWLPVMNALSAEFTIIGAEYRGFPESPEVLPEADYRFPLLVSDFMTIAAAENITRFHLAGWCLGAKIMLGIYDQHPEAVLSITALNMAYKCHDPANQGNFSRLVFQIKNKIAEDPGSIKRMIRIMDQVGVIPGADFLAMIDSEEEDSPSLNLYDFLENESSLSSLSFYLISNATGLTNYLNMYGQLSGVDGAAILKKVQVPFFILNGEKDHIIVFQPQELELFAANACIQQQTINEGSHFMLIEFPQRVARVIRENILGAVTELPKTAVHG